jgi:hypothetical protein
MEMPKEMNSPRAVIGFSFLYAVHWLKSRIRPGLRTRAGRETKFDFRTPASSCISSTIRTNPKKS